LIDILQCEGDIRKGLVGKHVYKIDGFYYHLYCPSDGLDGIQAALRSKNIYGPSEPESSISILMTRRSYETKRHGKSS
jgi:beta-xylosidase